MIPFEQFVDAIRRMAINRGNQYTKEFAPHKLCLLLAVIQSIEEGDFQDNKFCYEPQLLGRYDYYFKLIRPNVNSTRAYYPFIFMDSDDFWNLHDNDGLKLEISTYRGREYLATGHRKVSNKIGFASFDKDLFAHLQDTNKRQIFREEIINRCFQGATDQKQNFLCNFKEISQREKWQKIDENRSPTFRDTILKAYDYTCAATGWKLNGENGSSLLEAAHIVPLKEKPDNRPQNGMALSPTIHVAMDRNLIVPGPDACWHASNFLIREAKTDKGAYWLAQFHGLPLILPKEKHLGPTQSALEWRLEHLI